MKLSSKQREKRGATMMVLVMALAFMILPVVGLFSFEVGRANLCQQQLQNAVDAAALACSATLALNDLPDPVAAHDNAVEAAMNLFRQNTILGMDLTGANTVEVTNASTNPPAGTAHLFFEFHDRLPPFPVMPRTSATAQRVQVYGAIGAMPAFGRYLGINNFIVRTSSNGATPDLDVVLCYDCSGSIDDQTPVTVVRRVWNAATNRINYTIPPGVSQNTIYNMENPPPTGTSLNATPPQHLEQCTAHNWVPNLRAGLASGQYGTSEVGRPPGNSGGAVTLTPPPNITAPPTPFTFTTDPGGNNFTDIVVNIDGNNTFGGCTYNYGGVNYSFPDVATLVEAARGNLDNPAAAPGGPFYTSRAFRGVPAGIAPRAGYQAAYFAAAAEKDPPIRDARQASKLFCDIINNDAHGHFGFVAFNEGVGTDEGSSNGAGHPSVGFVGGQVYGTTTGVTPVPLSKLDPTPGNDRYQNIINCIQGGTFGGFTVATPGPSASGSTNIGAAIDAARRELSFLGPPKGFSPSHARQNAKRAIVLFTDGQPTAGGPLATDPWANARAAAVDCRNEGIPVYCIGLAQTPAIIPGQTSILNDTNPSASSGGIAAITGQGATFNLVTNQQELRLAFEKIARRLVQLTQI